MTLASIKALAVMAGGPSASITITVLYFASAQSATGLQRERVELQPEPESGGFPLSKLAATLAARHPQSKLDEVLRTSQWSVDEEMVPSDAVDEKELKGGETVAVIPPVSGG